MLNDIVNGISNAIYDEFGDKYKIYKEQIEQGLKEPCFSILCISPIIKKGLGNRYEKNNSFCIHYFAESKNFRSECMEVFERMADCLEYISVSGDLVRGLNIRAEEITEDGIMHVFVDYNIPVRKIVEQEKMGYLEQRAEVRNDG
ncbi:MAG: hypothetical protein KH020_07245 [Clostridiales bacterium]|nr:hypothetical protein [Clostridiales bacterium]